MKILWVPGHYFLGENERSEEEARRGGRSELSREESVNALSSGELPPGGESGRHFPPMRQKTTKAPGAPTTECPGGPGDLPKQRVGESTLGAHLVWAGPPPVLVGVGTEGGGPTAVGGEWPRRRRRRV